MRRFWYVLVLVLVCSVASAAILATVTVSSSAVTLGTTITGNYNTNKCWITTAGGNIRVRIDDTDPTTEVGHLVPDQTQLILTNVYEIHGFRAIQADSGVDVTLTASCWKE